jgi:transcriptional regulator with XRE-family HTH domain
LQPDVAKRAFQLATVGSVERTGDHWRKVCAPQLKRVKDRLGRGVPEREIAAAVHTASGKGTTRQLVSLWLHGQREPYISQFLALCDKLGVNWRDVMEPSPATRAPLARVTEVTRGVKKSRVRKTRYKGNQ